MDEKLTEFILYIIIIVIGGAIISAGLTCLIYTIFIYKGREVRIFVVQKRTNYYKGYDWKGGEYTTEHYVVYAKYPDSDKIHTLGCYGNVYQKLRANRGYNVTVKFMWINKVHREKFKSKKKK